MQTLIKIKKNAVEAYQKNYLQKKRDIIGLWFGVIGALGGIILGSWLVKHSGEKNMSYGIAILISIAFALAVGTVVYLIASIPLSIFYRTSITVTQGREEQLLKVALDQEIAECKKLEQSYQKEEEILMQKMKTNNETLAHYEMLLKEFDG